MKITRLEFTSSVTDLLVFARNNSIPIIIDYVKRHPVTQQILYSEGKSKTMNSRHLAGKAIDLYVIKEDGSVSLDEEDYRLLALFWEAKGERYKWQPFKGDIFHFEVH